MTFKIGDRVRCVEGYDRELEVGHECLVVAISEIGTIRIDETNDRWNASRFELIQPTQTATDRLERLEALARRIAATGDAEARQLVAEVEPDRDLIVARELVAATLDELGHPDTCHAIRRGRMDSDLRIKRVHEALRRARNEGNEA